jgi:hypothetical protein
MVARASHELPFLIELFHVHHFTTGTVYKIPGFGRYSPLKTKRYMVQEQDITVATFHNRLRK